MTVVGNFIDWIRAFFDKQFFVLFIATGLLFLLMYLTWWLYHTLSKRNIFNLHPKFGKMEYATTGDHIVYAIKYFSFFPLFTFLGFTLFALSLFLLIKPVTVDAQTNTLFIAIIMVSTIRVAAYVHENMAEDLAKLVPLTLFALVLSHPSLSSFGVTFDQFEAFFSLIPKFLKYLVFTVMLEGILRVSTWALHRNSETTDGNQES